MPQEIFEEIRVWVLAELIENEPITKIAVVKDITTGGEIWLAEASGFEEEQQASGIKYHYLCFQTFVIIYK